MNKSKIPTLNELKTLRKPIRNINVEQKESLSVLENFALWITKHVGTMGFFFIIAVWTLIWLSWNTFGPDNFRFDPFPGFVLWLFISNLIQLCLLPLIMIGQNLDNRHSEARAESEYEVNERSAREIETIIARLENQEEMLKKILDKINL